MKSGNNSDLLTTPPPYPLYWNEQFNPPSKSWWFFYLDVFKFMRYQLFLLATSIVFKEGYTNQLNYTNYITRPKMGNPEKWLRQFLLLPSSTSG